MSNVSIDGLVDEIARRVQSRLDASGAKPAPAHTGGGGGCSLPTSQDPSHNACEPCQGCHVHKPEAVRKLVRLGAARISAGSGNDAPQADLAGLIDHTLLKPEASREDLQRLCDEARRYHFATVCVNASNVRFCAAQLEGSDVKTIAVVGFPLGAATATAKAFEAREAVRAGAAEIDMVINIGALKSKEYAVVLDDISSVVAATAPRPVKVILETGSLTHDEKVVACSLSKIARAAFVKTSTGFGPGGATADDIRLMREIVGAEMGIKASGGMRTADDVRTMVEAGATRIGASASVAIVTGVSQNGRKRGRGAPRSGGY